jgi:hypothetical protein
LAAAHSSLSALHPEAVARWLRFADRRELDSVEGVGLMFTLSKAFSASLILAD